MKPAAQARWQSPGAAGGTQVALRATENRPGAVEASSERNRPFRIALPYPPSTNNLYATVNGHRVKTKAAREYDLQVANRMAIARGRPGGLPRPPYALSLVVWMPDRQRRDLSNTIKALEDAVFRSIGKDDRNVVRLHAVKRYDSSNPRVDVTLEHVEESLPAPGTEGE